MYGFEGVSESLGCMPRLLVEIVAGPVDATIAEGERLSEDKEDRFGS